MKLCENVEVSFSYLPQMVNAALDLMIDEEKGIHHLVHADRLSMYQYALELCAQLRLDTSCFVPYSNGASMSLLEPGRLGVMPPLNCAIETFAAHVPDTSVMSCLSA